MKNKIKTWGVMLKFMPPNERVGISPNRKRCSAAAATENGSMVLCVCACMYVTEGETIVFVHKYYEALSKFHISSSILTML